MSGTNDLGFVRQVVARLDSAGIRTWLSGGWAAELLGLSLPRPHHDVDLLYPAGSFEGVDVFLAAGEVDLLPSVDGKQVSSEEWLERQNRCN